MDRSLNLLLDGKLLAVHPRPQESLATAPSPSALPTESFFLSNAKSLSFGTKESPVAQRRRRLFLSEWAGCGAKESVQVVVEDVQVTKKSTTR